MALLETGADWCDFWGGFIADVSFDLKPTAVQFIAVVTAVVDTVASFGERQTHAVVEAAELPGGRTLEGSWETQQRV